MTLSRGLKYGGRTIAVLGVVLLLFVVYQLWGTSLQYARAQSELRDDFSNLLSQTAAFRDGAAGADGLSSSTEAVASSEGSGASSEGSSGIAILSSGDSSGTASLSSSTATLSGGIATLSAGAATPSRLAAEASISEAQPPRTLPSTSSNAETPQEATASQSSASPAETTRQTLLVNPSTRLPREDIENADLVYTPGSEEILPLLYPGNGEAVARIVIRAIDMDQIVVEGTDVDALRKGPGHYPWTPMPGQPGNASIAGHRTTYGAPFANIGNLRPGDKIIVQTAQGEFVYEVLAQDSPTKGYLIVSPDRVDLLRDNGNNLLTLTSCHPRFSNRQRIVVQAKLLGDPVVPMRDANARQEAPQELVSEDLTGVTDADVSAESNARETGNAAEAARVGETGVGETGVGETGVGETGTADRATEANAASSSGLENAQQTGSAAEPEDIASQAPIGTEADISEISDSGGASQDALSAASGSAGSTVSSADGSASQSATGTSFGSGLSGERSAIPSAALWFAATAILWGAVWLAGTRWRRLPSTAIGILPVLGCLFVAFSYLDRALPSY